MNRGQIPVPPQQRERRSRHGDKGNRGREGRDDPGLGRREPRRPGDRPSGQALPRRAGQDRRARWLHRPPGHLRHEEGLQDQQAQARPVREGGRRARGRGSSSSASTTSPTTSVGQELKADLLTGGDKVDVTAVSKGKGFAGAMKRHGFGGMPASHGAHRAHRAPGSIGACATPVPGVPRHQDGRPHGCREGDHAEPRWSSRPTPSATSSWSGAPSPAPRAPSSSSATPSRQVPDAHGRHQGRHGRQGRQPSSSTTPCSASSPNIPVMHQVVTAQLAAKRSGTQSTKTRAEVRGGGAKPWKQKGTGRARAGSSRSPHWVGGGVTHAPKPRDYAQRTPKKMIRLALKSALSDRASLGSRPRARLGPRCPQHQGRHRRAGRQRRRGSRARRAAPGGRGRSGRASATSTTSTSAASASSTPTTCSCPTGWSSRPTRCPSTSSQPRWAHRAQPTATEEAAS